MIQCNLNFEYQISKISNEQCNTCRSRSKPVSNAMARVYPCSFSHKLVYKIQFDGPIKGHHVYKETWTPQIDDIPYCKKDYRSEALDINEHAVGRLVCHNLTEVSRIVSYFLQESETNEVRVAVTGKRRRKLGFVVAGKYCTRTESKRTVKISRDQLKIIKEKYICFSWQYEEQEMYCKITVKKRKHNAKQLSQFFYNCWVELNGINPTKSIKFRRPGRLFINIVFRGVCITASRNILASGNLCFTELKLQSKVIKTNVCYLYSA